MYYNYETIHENQSDTYFRSAIKYASKNEVGNFIREAIQEKIKREYQQLILKPKKSECPF